MPGEPQIRFVVMFCCAAFGKRSTEFAADFVVEEALAEVVVVVLLMDDDGDVDDDDDDNEYDVGWLTV